MYARVMTMQLKPRVADSAAMKDQLKNWVKINEAQKKMKGFRSAHAGIDRAQQVFDHRFVGN